MYAQHNNINSTSITHAQHLSVLNGASMITDKRRLRNAPERKIKAALRTLVAFMCGFLCAFGTFLIYDNYTQLRQREFSTTIASFSYSDNDYPTLGDHLRHEVRVLCMILTYPKNHEFQARNVRLTWGKRCTKLIFISSESDEDLGAVQVIAPSNETYDDLWYKTREGLRYAYEEYLEEYDWFLKADDDTYVIMENLRFMLWAYTPEMPIFFGYKMERYGVKYMSGGSSYILSRESLKRFMNDAYYNETLCPPARKYGIEDFYMGICLQNVGVHLVDSKYALVTDTQTKMFPLDIRRYFTTNETNSIPTWLHDMTVASIETGANCCSNYSIAFHYMSPEFMNVFEFLIYRLHAFGLTHPNETLPMRLTMKQVTELFPFEENENVKDLKAMIDKPENF